MLSEPPIRSNDAGYNRETVLCCVVNSVFYEILP